MKLNSQCSIAVSNAFFPSLPKRKEKTQALFIYSKAAIIIRIAALHSISIFASLYCVT
jgi:hypothetical protein